VNTREQTELENAALANELSRQVAHEFSNFVYNLFLRIEIAENSPKAQPFDWQHLKQESRRMASLLEQWERFHSRTLAEETVEVDLHDLIRRAVGDASLRDVRVEVTPAISAETLGIMGCAQEVKHLLTLLLEGAILACLESTSVEPTVSVQTETGNDRAVVRILTGPIGVCAEPTSSLLEATCRSLAVRLEARIHTEPCGQHRLVTVDFPMRPRR
jgi:hypothetical protein